MHILDTDTLSLVFAGHAKVASRRDKVPAEEIAITIITWIELLRGRFDFVFKAADRAQVLRAQASSS
jgi:tRNA(fMet)-specific endonuclease VapC